MALVVGVVVAAVFGPTIMDDAGFRIRASQQRRVACDALQATHLHGPPHGETGVLGLVGNPWDGRQAPARVGVVRACGMVANGVHRVARVVRVQAREQRHRT